MPNASRLPALAPALPFLMTLLTAPVIAQEEEPRIDPVAPVPELIPSRGAVLYPARDLARLVLREQRRRVHRDRWLHGKQRWSGRRER